MMIVSFVITSESQITDIGIIPSPFCFRHECLYSVVPTLKRGTNVVITICFLKIPYFDPKIRFVIIYLQPLFCEEPDIGEILGPPQIAPL